MKLRATDDGMKRSFETLPFFQCELALKETVETMFRRKFKLMSLSRISRITKNGLQVSLSTYWKMTADRPSARSTVKA